MFRIYLKIPAAYASRVSHRQPRIKGRFLALVSPHPCSVANRLQGKNLGFALIVLISCLASRAQADPGKDQALEIRSVSVNGQPFAFRPNQTLRLPTSAREITLSFGAATNLEKAPLRMRYKLDGYDENWREVTGEMGLLLRFIDANQDPLKEVGFQVQGQSEHWTGSLESAAFVHRHQVITAPPGAKGIWVLITSAGPPNAVGVFAVTNLTVTRLQSGDRPAQLLLEWSPEARGEVSGAEWTPTDWMRNGLRTSMAKISQLGPQSRIKALTLLDNDPAAHAEWTTHKESAPPVASGDRLAIDWDEAYSIGLAGGAAVTYSRLPPSFYRFHVSELDLMGNPGQAEVSLAFELPAPFWRTPLFWGALTLLLMSAAAGVYRYVLWQQMRHQLHALESQRALEHERLRIAQDIHDDLGARVTQISLVSGLAQGDPSLSDKARSDFNVISAISRELVSALYETVWAVNPENDNLDALGNYLCQVVDNLCDKAQMRRRLRLAELPRGVQVSSHVRHNVVMAVKEAVHNIIKHAKASEVSMFVDWRDWTLTIRVQDDGCGFESNGSASGNGLANMRRRLQQLGGSCAIGRNESQGTTVTLQVRLEPVGSTRAEPT